MMLGGLLAACTTSTIEPTPTSLAQATPTATQTRLPTPTLTITALPTTATLPPPAQTPTRTRTSLPTSTRTRVPSTLTPTRTSLPPLEWDARLDALDIKLIPATVQTGQLYWRLTKAEFWDEKQRQGKNHIFINVLDESGIRIIGQKVFIEWPGEKLILVTEDKPAPEYSANFPLDINHYPPWGTLGAFTASVDGLPSERVAGMGLPSMNKLVVYLLTFQRAQR